MNDHPLMPECDRLVEVAGESQKLGEFLDWLTMPVEDGGRGLAIARWQTMKECPGEHAPWKSTAEFSCHDGVKVAAYRWYDRQLSRWIEDGEPLGECSACDGTGQVERIDPILVQAGESFEKLLAGYFGIDLAKVGQERKALLAHMQSYEPAP